MSRHTHIEDDHQHDRGTLRHREITHGKRDWRAAKDQVSPHALEFHRHGEHGLPPEVVSELCAALDCGDKPVIFLEPEQIKRLPAELRARLAPYARNRTALKDASASHSDASHPVRAAQKREWEGEVDSQLGEVAEAA